MILMWSVLLGGALVAAGKALAAGYYGRGAVLLCAVVLLTLMLVFEVVRETFQADPNGIQILVL